MARGIQLSHNAAAAGAWRGVSSGSGGPVVPPEWQHTRRHNLQRSYRRWATRNSMWPKEYWAEIRMLDPNTGGEKTFWIAFLLVHELMQNIWELGNIEMIQDINGADPLTRSHIEQMRVKLTLPHLIGLGLWGDEIPCYWDRSESISALTINLPGLGGQWRNMRVPLCAINHAYWGPNSWHDVLGVVAWSMRWLAHGHHPTSRHDDRPWFFPGSRFLCDTARQATAGTPLLGNAILAECRGDWKFFAEAYGMPLWNCGQGICWDCKCTKEEVFILSKLLTPHPPQLQQREPKARITEASLNDEAWG